MMLRFLDRLDVLILTWNEEANIGRTLDALTMFPRVVVLDSASTDETVSIALRYPNVRVCTRAFDSHANQWNHGLTGCAIESEWVLALDADYVLGAEVSQAIAQLTPQPSVHGYRASFRYCVQGHPLRASLYPPVTVLFRREGARYVQDGHTQRVVLGGPAGTLPGKILHDDRKSFSSWLAAQDRYARLECELLLDTPASRLGWRDRLRRLTFITPWLVPLYCLTAGLGLLDGRRGLIYALQRGIAESILSVRLLQARLAGRQRP